jgi:hypothetical protein
VKSIAKLKFIMKAISSVAFNEFHGTTSDKTARQIGSRTILNGMAQHFPVKSARQYLL